MNINEIFLCLQGEGKTIGQPRLLIRFNGCNLSCNFCDTKYTWGKGDIKINLNNYDNLLKENKRWMITGGEPLLFQEEIKDLINIYRPEFVEIETNGTIKVKDFLLNKINLFNISPKEEYYQVRKDNVEPFLLEQKEKLNDYVLKFVIENKENLKIIEDIKSKYMIDNNKIFLMPLSYFNEEKDKTKRQEIYNLALKENYNFCPRLHVVLFNKERDK